jgi:hypothetical protein
VSEKWRARFPSGAKSPYSFSGRLRGAEAPLFHACAGIHAGAEAPVIFVQLIAALKALRYPKARLAAPLKTRPFKT